MPAPPPWEDSLPVACIRSGACSIQTFPALHNCVDYYQDMLISLGQTPVWDPIYRCVNRAQDCEAVRQCYGPVEPCDSSYQASCQEGQALFCDLIDHLVYRHDCASAGLSCQLDAVYAHAADCVSAGAAASTLTAAADCTLGICQQTNESCTGDDVNRCDGSDLEGCLEGHWVRFSCSALGLGPCQQETAGWARCSEPAS